MKKHLLLLILFIVLFNGIGSAQTTGTFVVADKTTRVESCIDSTITLDKIIEAAGIRDLNDPNDDASMYKMFQLQGSVITTTEITGAIHYTDYTQVFVQKTNATQNSNHYGLPITLYITIPPTRLFKKDTLKYTVDKGAKVNYTEDFFTEFELFSSSKDPLKLDERISFTDQATGIETFLNDPNASNIWNVGKGKYKLKAKVSVCTPEDYYYDSIYVIVTESPCLSVELKNIPSLCRDEIIDIRPYIYVDGHLATPTELTDLTFRNKSFITPPANPALAIIDPSALNMKHLVNDTTLIPIIEIAYAPNVALNVCSLYSYRPALKVPTKFIPGTDIIFTNDNNGKQVYYMLEPEYYAFNNTFSKNILKKLYLDNYAVHAGTTFDFYTDNTYQSPVSGNNLTAGTYSIVATNPACTNDSTSFTVTIKNRDFEIVWHGAENLGQGYYTFTAPTYPGATYQWMAWSGSITSQPLPNSNQITIYFPDNNTGNSPFVSCKIILPSARITGASSVLASAVYLTTSNGVKEEITEEGITTETLSPETTHTVYAYPNPAAETFALSGTGISDVKVYNTLGQLIYSNSSYTAESPIAIQSKGLHVVHVRQQGNLQTLKIVLQ